MWKLSLMFCFMSSMLFDIEITHKWINILSITTCVIKIYYKYLPIICENDNIDLPFTYTIYLNAFENL